MNIKGLAFPAFLFVILNKIISKKEESFILENIAKECINSLDLEKKNINTLDRQKWIFLLNKLDVFGLGRFNIKTKIDNTIIIDNKNNSYANLYKALFNKQDQCIDLFSSMLLKYLFEKITDEKYEVIEKECIAKGANSCIFYVNHL